MHTAELEKLACPQCGSRKFATYSMEELTQDMEDGDWGDHEFTDDVYLTFVKCKSCGFVILDRISSVKDAIQQIVFKQPERERQAAELEKWAEEQKIDVEKLADEEVLDYYSCRGANVLNDGPLGMLECLLKIYGTPQEVKDWLCETLEEQREEMGETKDTGG